MALPNRVFKYSVLQPVADNATSEGLYPVTLSDGSIDRHGDTVSPDGWQLDSYTSNPVLLWGHDGDTRPPIGKVLNIRVQDSKLQGDLKFASTPFAQEIKGLVDEGMLGAVSVGFRPLEGEESDRKGNNPWFAPMDFTKQELLELSIVSVPANPNAKIGASYSRKSDSAAKADLIIEHALDVIKAVRGDGEWVTKARLEALRYASILEPAPEPEAPAPAEPAAEPAPEAAPKEDEISNEVAAELVRSAVAERLATLRMKRTGKID